MLVTRATEAYEPNYLINPAHPDFSLRESLEIENPVTFEVDLRLLGQTPAVGKRCLSKIK
jgi:hypothetical protein